MIKWNSPKIPKVATLPARLKIDVDGDLRGSQLSAVLQVPEEACVGPVRTQWELPVTLQGSCRVCVELPEELCECVRAGRFDVVVYDDCNECIRCPIDFVSKRGIKCVELEVASNQCEACC